MMPGMSICSTPVMRTRLISRLERLDGSEKEDLKERLTQEPSQRITRHQNRISVTTMNIDNTKGPALVFGASGEQGRAVVEGLVDANYHPVYAFGRDFSSANSRYLTDALGATIRLGDIQNPDHVLKAFTETKATAIVLITTTDLPSEMGETSGFSDAAEAEFQVISNFFCILKQAYEKDGIPRHVVFSCRENVQRVNRQHYDKTGEVWMEALDDGSIVPHFSAKGRGGEFGLDYLKNISDLKLTLATLPFLYSNFLGFFCPLPDEGKTQWTLSACFGDGDTPVDMIGPRDLSTIIPNIFANPEKYDNQDLRLVGERISMDQVARAFEDLYGKPVIYNPLTPSEVSAMPFAAAPAMAQMCQFIGDPRSFAHDLEGTQELMGDKKPQSFEDWLLTHSESSAFQLCGLTEDAPEITSVTVFGASSPEGTSVIKGLLADSRKTYKIRAVANSGHPIKDLDPERIELVEVDLSSTESCLKAVTGVDGVFLVTHFLQEDHAKDLKAEELQIRNVIDACESAKSVRHLVFSTLESAVVMNHHGKETGHLAGSNSTQLFDARTRASAYARTKKLSVSYVLLPFYSENFLHKMKRRLDEKGNEKIVMDDDDTATEKNSTKVVCMSIEDLGPAVANIFDSYQVYSGHEIGLVTDFASYMDFKEMMQDSILKGPSVDDSTPAAEKKVEEEVASQPSPKHAHMQDFGQMFGQLAHSDAVKMRRSVAKTMQLVPSAHPLRSWIEKNLNNEDFREKLGLR